MHAPNSWVAQNVSLCLFLPTSLYNCVKIMSIRHRKPNTCVRSAITWLHVDVPDGMHAVFLPCPGVLRHSVLGFLRR